MNVVLKNVLKRSFPEEYEQNQRSSLVHGVNDDAQDRPLVPIFVMNSLLPGEKMLLNIFEPRYRLMIRRVMEGSKRFGMATVDENHQLSDVRDYFFGSIFYYYFFLLFCVDCRLLVKPR